MSMAMDEEIKWWGRRLQSLRQDLAIRESGPPHAELPQCPWEQFLLVGDAVIRGD